VKYNEIEVSTWLEMCFFPKKTPVEFGDWVFVDNSDCWWLKRINVTLEFTE
jgi:hypothetical protein